MTSPRPASAPPVVWTSQRTIVVFGLVSLFADMVYEGMRSIAGPFLGSLGASALTVGIITGAGEAVALLLRLGTGALADRSGRYWTLTVVGYAMTAVCVPLLALAPALGAAGVAAAAVLILLERTGKAVRSPAKSTLLAGVAEHDGRRGRAFGIHKALDQVGAFAGPLVVAAVAAASAALWTGFAVLAIPGAVSLVLLALLARRVPSLTRAPAPVPSTVPSTGPDGPRRHWRDALGLGLPTEFHRLALGCALATAGLMTFGVLSFRFVDDGIVPLAAAPLVYALAMATAAAAALVAGSLFDRRGASVLMVVPVLVALVPPLAFADSLAPVLLGIALWGLAGGVLDSTVKAQVAAVVPATQRATGYGVFAAVQGLGALLGGAVAGALVTDHVTALMVAVAVAQVAAVVLIARSVRGRGVSPGR